MKNGEGGNDVQHKKNWNQLWNRKQLRHVDIYFFSN